MKIDQLKTIVCSYNAVTRFIEGGQMAETLALLGATELKAAMNALKKIDSFSDKRSHILSVKTHLESAHAAFSGIWNPDSFVKQHLGSAKKADAAEEDIWTLCLLVICYIYLGEFNAIRGVIDEIEKAKIAVFHLTHICPDDDHKALKIVGGVADYFFEYFKPIFWWKSVTGQRKSLIHYSNPDSNHIIYNFFNEVNEFESAVIETYEVEAGLFDYRKRIRR